MVLVYSSGINELGVQYKSTTRQYLPLNLIYTGFILPS